MRSWITTATAILGFSSTLAIAAPAVPRSVNFSPLPLRNGFPNPNQTETKQIQKQAFGTLPNGAVPSNISAEGLNNLRVIALNELFEVAFFTQLLSNVTHDVPGYTVKDKDSKAFLVQTLTAVQAQEELHALNANGALKHFGAAPIQPCRYNFPVSDLQSALTLAGTFTSVVLGTLQDVIQIFAQNGDAPLTTGIASVIGQEGEQEGWYRLLQGKIPNELPFLTASTRDFAVNALNQTFFVPGSCPNLQTIKTKTFEPLTLLDTPKAKTESIRFSFQNSTSVSAKDLRLVYINQQNNPIVKNFKVVQKEENTVTIEATFPYDAYLLNGLTIAVLADANKSLNSLQNVSDATKFGPALIIVN
ncbi:hypothetical protein DTO195F2_134 [Paecilomyces variotii]|nr:hypothetical protein DTO195F2_134 [Paecilomyces variotii]KAJ9392131.1 hypothetical protein DTO063F5_890 [Paecilomyces variotii]